MNYGYVAYGVCDFRCDAKKITPEEGEEGGEGGADGG